MLAIYQRSLATMGSGGGGPRDSDGDGVPDISDNCPCVYNPGQPDDDNDGYGNHCEPVVEEEQQTVMAEWLIYGNTSDGRFATVKPVGLMRQEEAGDTIQEYREVFARVLDEKVYELKDHLGNVRVVISDVKLNGGAPNPQSGQRPYMADLRSYNNYFAFGMLQPDRSWSAGGHRYGFNGKEMDNDWNDKDGVGTGVGYPPGQPHISTTGTRG